MNWNTMTTTAITNSRWTNPPAVYELTMPSSNSTRRITAIVHSMAPSLDIAHGNRGANPILQRIRHVGGRNEFP